MCTVSWEYSSVLENKSTTGTQAALLVVRNEAKKRFESKCEGENETLQEWLGTDRILQGQPCGEGWGSGAF